MQYMEDTTSASPQDQQTNAIEMLKKEEDESLEYNQEEEDRHLNGAMADLDSDANQQNKAFAQHPFPEHDGHSSFGESMDSNDEEDMEEDDDMHSPQVLGPHKPEYDQILTADALDFLASLSSKLEDQRQDLLIDRHDRQRDAEQNTLKLDFRPETSNIREDSTWECAPIPKDLQDRRYEITGSSERRSIINALNTNAKVFMCDMEDYIEPSWHKTMQGLINLRDAVNRDITAQDENGNTIQLKDTTATLMVRPRGLNTLEKNVLIEGSPVSAALFDFGLYFFHNARTLIDQGSGPYFYIPGIESYQEARWWNDLFKIAQQIMEIPQGTIRATVLVENVMAVFEMEEILYELREHSAGLNCGRWDYIFTFFNNLKNNSDFHLDRSQVLMTTHFMNSYVELLVKTGRKRGASVMGYIMLYDQEKFDWVFREADVASNGNTGSNGLSMPLPPSMAYGFMPGAQHETGQHPMHYPQSMPSVMAHAHAMIHGYPHPPPNFPMMPGYPPQPPLHPHHPHHPHHGFGMPHHPHNPPEHFAAHEMGFHHDDHTASPPGMYDSPGSVGMSTLGTASADSQSKAGD